jgi:ribose transport system ATP-binding protein
LEAGLQRQLSDRAAVTDLAVAPHDASAAAAAEAPLLRTEGLTKQFPGVLALDAVDFDLRAGEVHVLFGENGAGKSTLVQTLAGVHRPTSGAIYVRGTRVEIESVHQARLLGISAVFQEFSLVPTLTVEENIFLGAEVTQQGLLNKRELHRRAQAIVDQLGFPLRPQQRVQYLSRAEQQMVEIAKAFRAAPAVLILDEPTASLTERETERLFTLIEQIKREGVGIIYISHRMSENRRIGDRVTVLRDGRRVDTVPMAAADDETLLRMMTGRVITQIFPTIRHRPDRLRLEADRVTTADNTVVGASIKVAAGEIVGLAGLVGCGKSELGRACFGIERVASGQIRFDGADVTGKGPAEMIRRGLYYIPSDRREEGLVMVRSVRENVSLPALRARPFTRWGVLDRGVERQRVVSLAERMNLQPRNIERDVQYFSGGNQQKVLLAKALTRDISLFIFDEPTVGVDVGTRVAIYGFIRDLCEAGAGVLLISSDLPEILHLTNRVYVMYRGAVRAELAGAEITQDAVLGQFFEGGAAA